MDHIQLSPSDSAIGIVLVLFAGSWSDKSGRRKPCILVPQVGESLGQLGEEMKKNENDESDESDDKSNFCCFQWL